MSQLLFVCTGNTCRSPMAEAVMKVLLRAHGLDGEDGAAEGVVVLSAGLSAFEGEAASRQAMAAVEPIGGDLRNFRSRRLTEELVNASDLIVVMTAGHRRQLLGLYPQAAAKTKLLLEFAGYPFLVFFLQVRNPSFRNYLLTAFLGLCLALRLLCILGGLLFLNFLCHYLISSPDFLA